MFDDDDFSEHRSTAIDQQQVKCNSCNHVFTVTSTIIFGCSNTVEVICVSCDKVIGTVREDAGGTKYCYLDNDRELIST